MASILSVDAAAAITDINSITEINGAVRRVQRIISRKIVLCTSVKTGLKDFQQIAAPRTPSIITVSFSPIPQTWVLV